MWTLDAICEYLSLGLLCKLRKTHHHTLLADLTCPWEALGACSKEQLSPLSVNSNIFHRYCKSQPLFVKEQDFWGTQPGVSCLLSNYLCGRQSFFFCHQDMVTISFGMGCLDKGQACSFGAFNLRAELKLPWDCYHRSQTYCSWSQIFSSVVHHLLSRPKTYSAPASLCDRFCTYKSVSTFCFPVPDVLCTVYPMLTLPTACAKQDVHASCDK